MVELALLTVAVAVLGRLASLAPLAFEVLLELVLVVKRVPVHVLGLELGPVGGAAHPLPLVALHLAHLLEKLLLHHLLVLLLLQRHILHHLTPIRLLKPILPELPIIPLAKPLLRQKIRAILGVRLIGALGDTLGVVDFGVGQVGVEGLGLGLLGLGRVGL